MDEFAFYNSQQEQKNEFIFQNSQYVYCPDQNSGSYPNGQVKKIKIACVLPKVGQVEYLH